MMDNNASYRLAPPVFSDAQRQSAVEAMHQRIQSEKLIQMDENRGRKRRAPSDDNTTTQGSAAPKRRAGRPRLSAPAPPENENKTPSQPEICEITREPINIHVLKDLASRRASGFTRVPGSNMTIREMIFYFLQCCNETVTYANGLEIGILPVVWRENACEE